MIKKIKYKVRVEEIIHDNKPENMKVKLLWKKHEQKGCKNTQLRTQKAIRLDRLENIKIGNCYYFEDVIEEHGISTFTFIPTKKNLFRLTFFERLEKFSNYIKKIFHINKEFTKKVSI